MDVPIKYYSTNLVSPEVSFREALLTGLAPDGGLYMPSLIPAIDSDRMSAYRSMEYNEIAYDVLMHFLEDEIDGSTLKMLCKEAYNFEIPLEEVFANRYILRLDRGPTASFKDFAARMMAKLMNHFASEKGLHYTILTATSGDTGSAVANAFHKTGNIDVVILFPLDEVSAIQRKQMTTLGENIHIIAVDGKFDDCQHMVKRAFTDPSLSHLDLSSANSINAGRLLPQSVYYFYAWSRLAAKSYRKVNFSVPSGNFGNLMGGLIAREMGLPVERFIISTNSNNEVPEYLRTGIYNIISPSINCISSAMNVGHPSNMSRIVALYGGSMDEKGHILKEPDHDRIRRDMWGVGITEEETRRTISECWKKYGTILEPHGAVAWKGLEKFLGSVSSESINEEANISLETANPAKFPEEITKILGNPPPLPRSLQEIVNLTEDYVNLDNDYQALKEYILKL